MLEAFQLFRKESITYVRFPCGALYSVSDDLKAKFLLEMPKGCVEIKPYPHTGVANTPPSSIFPLIEAAFDGMQQGYAKKLAESNEKGA
jgi:hypothetical protein